MEKLTPEQQDSKREQLGLQIVGLLSLKQARDDNGNYFNPPRYNTSYGTKTAIGLYLTISRIINGD